MANQYDNMVVNMDIDEFKKLVSNSSGYYDILKKIGYKSKSLTASCKILRKRINENNIDISHFGENKKMTKRSIIWKMPIDEFKKLILENYTYSSILRHFGLANVGNNSSTLKRRLQLENIDISHFDPKKKQMCMIGDDLKNKKSPLEKMFCINSTFKRCSIRNRIIEENLIDYKCQICGNNGYWINKPVSLVLDHINGVRNDHRLENLRFLCPNCNAQTETFCGRNPKYEEKLDDWKFRHRITGKMLYKANNYKGDVCKVCNKEITVMSKNKLCPTCFPKSRRLVERPPYDELIREIEETNMSVVGRKYGVSSNAIKKWVKYYEKNETELLKK